MSEYITIARPYAKAAFEFAIQHNSIDDWQTMLLLATQVSNNNYLNKLLSSTVLTYKQLADIFFTICNDKQNIYIKNFFYIIAKNQRLIILPYVLKIFINLRDQYEKTIKVKISSITKLNEIQITKIITSIKLILSDTHKAHKIKLNYHIDKSIIAGIIICIGDMIIDGSVRSRLERLTKSLAV